MVVIPPGSFTSGYTRVEKSLLHDPSLPDGIKVAISESFSIAKYELTIAEYRACVYVGSCHTRLGPRDTPEGVMTGMDTGEAPGVIAAITGEVVGSAYDNLPMRGMSLENIEEYITWINKLTGKKYRLPTRVEWIYAARSGTEWAYTWGNSPQPNKAFAGRAYDLENYPFLAASWLNVRHNVGLLAANRWGLYDMIGNVEEVVMDCRYDPLASSHSARSLCLLGDGDYFPHQRISINPIGSGFSVTPTGVVLGGVRLVSDLN